MIRKWYIRTDNASSFDCFVGSVDKILDTIIGVWYDVDKRNLLSVNGSRRDQPQPVSRHMTVAQQLMPNTHRQRWRDSTVKLSRVGVMKMPVAVVTQFTIIYCAVQLFRWVTNDDIITSLLKKLSVAIKIHEVKPLWSLFAQFQNNNRIRRQL